MKFAASFGIKRGIAVGLTTAAAGAILAAGLHCVSSAFQEDGLPTQEVWQRAERDIKRLAPSAFRKLPAPIIRGLESRGCTIPQTPEITGPHNVVRGEFARKGQTDWAVLCSREGKSSILIFWGGAAKCKGELVMAEDKGFLQGMGKGRIEFARRIDRVGKKLIMQHYEWYGGPKPPPIDHEGIDDAFPGKASVVHYCHSEEWLDLQGAD